MSFFILVCFWFSYHSRCCKCYHINQKHNLIYFKILHSQTFFSLKFVCSGFLLRTWYTVFNLEEVSQGIVVLQLAEYEFEKNSNKVVDNASEVKPRKQNEGDQNGETSCLALVRFANPEDKKQIKVQ